MGKYSSYATPADERNTNMVGNYSSHATTTKGMEVLDQKGLLQWQDSAAYNMTKTSVEREKLLNEQIKADMANKAALAKMAGQYLGSWNEMLNASNNMLNTAAQSISDLMKAPASGAWDKVDAAIADINANVKDYQQKYGGLEAEAINTAISELGAERELTAQMRSLARADTEGAATRAKMDVASEFSAARSKMADDLIALGIDPTSGAGRSTMRQSMDAEALNKVMAGNRSRIDEKNRSAAATATALQSIDPSRSAGIAHNIATGKREMMEGKAQLTMAGIDAQNKELQARASMADSLAKTASGISVNASQVGDLGAALLGSSLSLTA